MSSRRSQRSAATKAKEAIHQIADMVGDSIPRSRRVTGSEKISTATVSRGPPSASSKSPTSLRLTVKTSSTKLQKATSSATSTPSKTISVNSREKLDGGDIIEGKRARNTRKSYVLESESEEDEAMDDVVDDDDAEGESIEEDEDMDAEGEEDADGDIDMDIPPPPPVITISKAKSGRSTIVAKPPAKAVTKTVEQKEVAAGSDDEKMSDLSDLESELNDDVEEEEGMQVGDEEDAEGEDDDLEVDEDAEGEEDGFDSDDETPMGGSRASTPDLNKLTKRQRARLEEGGSGHLLALPDGKPFPKYNESKLTKLQRSKSRNISLLRSML